MGELTEQEQEQYYQESKTTGRLLGLLPTYMPGTVKELQHYVMEMTKSNQLAATPQARRIARMVFYPPLPKVIRPLLHLNRQITIAMLAPEIRNIYDLQWSSRRQQAFEVSARNIKKIVPQLPMFLRELPTTRHMRQMSAA